MTEDLMRAGWARFGQLLEVVLTTVGYNLAVYGASLYAVQVMRTARTVFDYTVALYIIASALVMAAKGAEMVHRKWGEYARVEQFAESAADGAPPGFRVWHNPSLDVSTQSRSSVRNINILAVATLVGLVVVVSCFQILVMTDFNLLASALRVLPPLIIAGYAGYMWATASK
jgi:hypothetical protein